MKRIDPPSRPVDGAMTEAAHITNKDLKRHYILANPNDPWCGVQEMQRLGYEIERHRKDGPRVIGGETAKDGDVLTLFGQYVMSEPLDRYREREARKQSVADMRSNAIGQPGGVDQVRGATGRLANWAVPPDEHVVTAGE